jgi:enoyl-CoA hydratase/carnithine racemase
LLEEALKVAATIASKSIPVSMMVKESVNRAFEVTLSEGVRFERRVFHAAFATEDQRRHGRLHRQARGAVQGSLMPAGNLGWASRCMP